MALLRCPDCSRDVSSAASACPHCGCPLVPRQATPSAGGTRNWACT